MDLLLKNDRPHLAVAIPQSSLIANCAGKKLMIFNQMTKCADQVFELPHKADALCCGDSEVTLVA